MPFAAKETLVSPFDFCYWLQGYLELRSNPHQPLTPTQTYLLKEHLKLVEHPSLPFLLWLQGVFDSHDCHPTTTLPLAKIQERLSLTFHHYIDPSYPPHLQPTLQALHSRTSLG